MALPKLVDLIARWDIRESKKLTRFPLNRLLRKHLTDMECGNSLFIGAGGGLESLVREVVFGSITTVDIDTTRGPDLVMSASKLEIKSCSIDTVFLLEVLEHVDQPFVAVQETFRVLKPGGKLIFSSPFLFPIHDAPGDYWRFTKFGLLKIFEPFSVLLLAERSGFVEGVFAILSRLRRDERALPRFIGRTAQLTLGVFRSIISRIDQSVSGLGTLGYFMILEKPTT